MRSPSPPRPAKVVMALAMLLVALSAACSSDGGTAASTPTEPDGVPTNCENVHAGHSAMMWNPTMADEMLDADCGWPYEPFLVDLEGGQDVAELSAPFEPVRYDRLWSAISSTGLGVCSVSTDLDREIEGRAFGFTYLVAPPGCPDALPTGSLVVSEFGTEAQRDAAATALEADGTAVFVLGRWVIEVSGETDTMTGALDEIGAQVAS